MKGWQLQTLLTCSKRRLRNRISNQPQNTALLHLFLRNSRQEFAPLVGKLIDCAHVDPLHLKNNARALAHRYLLNEVVGVAHLPSSISFPQVPASFPFGKYAMTLRYKCNLSRLAKQIVRWFNENRGKEFDYRFTGKDSRLFLQNFMLLISSVDSHVKKDTREELILHVLAYTCLCLRDCVPIFTRVAISDDDITKVRRHCSYYFKAHAIFLNVNPTVWTLGNVVPHHIGEMKAKYGMGLGLNSMEGREAKHVLLPSIPKTHFTSTDGNKYLEMSRLL